MRYQVCWQPAKVGHFRKGEIRVNEYIMDMTVTVIILLEAGWELYNWAGPVFNEEGNPALSTT